MTRRTEFFEIRKLTHSKELQSHHYAKEKSQKSFMAQVTEEFSAIQALVLAAETELDKLDRPETTLEDLHKYEESLRVILEKLKALTSRVKADRSPNKQVWQRYSLMHLMN